MVGKDMLLKKKYNNTMSISGGSRGQSKRVWNVKANRRQHGWPYAYLYLNKVRLRYLLKEIERTRRLAQYGSDTVVVTAYHYAELHSATSYERTCRHSQKATVLSPFWKSRAYLQCNRRTRGKVREPKSLQHECVSKYCLSTVITDKKRNRLRRKKSKEKSRHWFKRISNQALPVWIT